MRIEDLLAALPAEYTDIDRGLIARAYRVAAEAHEGQKRASGEPYVTHCLAVAEILASLRVPPAVIAAGLLHDTVEDTKLTLADLRREFGEEIARMVDGVTKLTELPRVSRGDQHFEELEKESSAKELAARRGQTDADFEQEQFRRSRKFDVANETLRKTFMAMGEDPRVPLIKLADRLHNMRTLTFMPERKREQIARQTLEIFAPLANRLGIWQMKWELEDLSFRYTEPEVYQEIAEKLAERRSERESQMEEITRQIEKLLRDASISARVSGRPKHINSIYRKMVRKGVSFDQVHDVRGVRIIVEDQKSCYSALGEIHAHWRPIPGQFDDYIAAPKDNDYRSIHTAVYYDDGRQLEVQIRTPEMDEAAEFGIAAHWVYKEGGAHNEKFQQHVLWLRKLMDWRQDVDDAGEFIEAMKNEVFQDRVYVITPRGDVIDLPVGATPIDFAYHIHTDVGHRCRGAKVNGKLVSLDYPLKTGEQVEILTARRGGPSRDWLNQGLGLVKTTRARSKISHWFKTQDREQNIAQGKDSLEKELRRLGMAETDLDDLARGLNYKTQDDLFAALGTGDLSSSRVISQLQLEKPPEFLIPTRKTSKLEDEEVEVLGVRGLLVKFGRCCNPAPGDDIIGYVTRGRGATVHRKDCPNMLNIRDRERLVRVSWGTANSTYPVSIQIHAYDRDGLAQEVFALIANERINVADVEIKTRKNLAIFDMVLEVNDVPQLSRVLSRIEQLPNVQEARRVQPG